MRFLLFFTKQHGDTYQKTVLFIFTKLRKSDVRSATKFSTDLPDIGQSRRKEGEVSVLVARCVETRGSVEGDDCHTTARSRPGVVSYSEWFSDATLVWKSDVVQLWRSCHTTSRQNLFACVTSGGPILYRFSSECSFRSRSVNADTHVGRYRFLLTHSTTIWGIIFLRYTFRNPAGLQAVLCFPWCS